MNSMQSGFKSLDNNKRMIKTLKEREKEHLQSILTKTNWDRNKAAHLLKISISKLERKIRKHHLKRS